MRKIAILITIGLILTFRLEAKKIEGIIIFEDDTVYVTFKIPVIIFSREPNFMKLQYKVKYYDSGGKKIVLRPDSTKEIRFIYNSENVRMLSRFNSLETGKIFTSSNNIFLKLETDGTLKLFNFYFEKRSPGIYNPATGASTSGETFKIVRNVLQKEDGELKQPESLTFKKDMVEYFSDCPELAEKIESNEFQIDNLDLIVKFYNSRCK